MSTHTKTIMQKSSTPRSGATLILTLGILAIISVLTVTFLLSARLQKKAAITSRNQYSAETSLNTALAYAMQQIEDSFSYPNFTDEKMEFPNGSNEKYQRLAPVTRWFSEKYSETNDINPNIAFDYDNILTSPSQSTNTATINLLTPEALALIPAALTNDLPLNSNSAQPLRSGWIAADNLPNGSPLEWQLQNKPSRIAYAIFNCSSTIDANVFPGEPTDKKKQRRYFSQKSVSSVADGDQEGSDIQSYLQSNHVALATEEMPFFHTSYDPNPNTFRYYASESGSETDDILGRDAFASRPPVDLNRPNYFQALAALTSGNLPYNKFNLNSITNILEKYGPQATERWYNDPALNLNWLLPTVFLSDICRKKYGSNEPLSFDSGSDLAWSIANFIDENRIPEISNFTSQELATRVNYAVEDVPLINKITIFDIFKNERGPQAKNPDYYDVDTSLSNHYAVAVEVWYPFAPNPPSVDASCYVGIYTNESDVITSTNRPMSNREMERWFEWIFAGTSNSVMQILFQSWAWQYEQEVGTAYLINHPLWWEITDNGDLWFTPAMTNHPSWPVADTNGNFDIEDTPIHEAFYPDTYDEITTNSTGIVSTNSYTYETYTNYWLNIQSPAGETNEFAYGQYVFEHDYLVMFWFNPESGQTTSNLMSGIINEDGDFVPLDYETNRAAYLLFGDTPDDNYIIYENTETGELGTNFIAGMVLSPDTNTQNFVTYTNFYNESSLERIEPLYIPPDLDETLNALFAMLPTNNISDFYNFLLMTPDDFIDQDWDNIFRYFDSNPSLGNTILPRMEEPSLGNLDIEDRYLIYPESNIDAEFVEFDSTRLGADNFEGYFWTIYPKTTISFQSLSETTPAGGAEPEGPTEVVTNYYELGALMPGNSKPNTIWIRPAVTIPGYDPDEVQVGIGAGIPAAMVDKIVDEALLLPKDGQGKVSVQGWTAVTNLYIAEPHNNAYARNWESFDENWDIQNNQTNLSYGVAELPFIHFNSSLKSIGDLGHVYTAYRNNTAPDSGVRAGMGNSSQQNYTAGVINNDYAEYAPYDTINFSTRSGASLLDFFTVSDNKPMRGLIQANTTVKPTLDILFSNIQLGWTNHSQSVVVQTETLPADMQEKWSELWCEALTNNLFNTGWRSFADMLPALSTNEYQQEISTMVRSSNLHTKHNYTEDVIRQLIDKVSFRQNVFVIILAAQTLAPGSAEEQNPTVLAEQRAAVTVIRDAYSGNWTIAEWRKLTQ